jgi:hypothetical protein
MIAPLVAAGYTATELLDMLINGDYPEPSGKQSFDRSGGPSFDLLRSRTDGLRASPDEACVRVGVLPGARAAGSAAQDVDADATSGEENGTIAAWWS